MCSVRIAVLLAASAAGLQGAQSSDTTRVLADLRAALGGDAELAAVRALTLEGSVTRHGADGPAGTAMPLAIALQLPDEYVRRDQLGQFNGTPITRTVGSNGSTPLEAMGGPQIGGGRRMFVRAPG